jgi:hypothetical protein
MQRVSGRIDLLVQSEEGLAIIDLEISNNEQRRAEIQINFGRFEQLEEVYRSDIERLEAIEEAGFLLALGGTRIAPYVGPRLRRNGRCMGFPTLKGRAMLPARRSTR